MSVSPGIQTIIGRMKRVEIVSASFLKSPKQYVIQSVLAIMAVVVILNFVTLVSHSAIVAALGASTFIVFTLPGSVAARPRRLIGGPLTGLISGLACYYLFYASPLASFEQGVELLHWIPAAVSVGLSVLLMTIFNTEHPPAAGIALGFVSQQWTFQTIIFVLVYALTLALVKWLLRSYLKDLYN